ncbi:hypothetical protein PR048_001121 [Dryococelus australis]|uniref:DUF4371 domain-containing protein n=1 Tax=Dryococelus australis TaxID=614101 RepID=A0ABQ9IGH9_9NEOP|nr:hypothetical protein PR048_001121 [Dryococelus australis]
MVDESTDISIKEQLAFCIRYFNTTSYEIQEKFFKFIDVVDVSGKTLLAFCTTYDRGSNMSGKFKGVQVHIAKVQPLAIYSHCENHRLNLGITGGGGGETLGRCAKQDRLKKHDAVLTFLDKLPCLPVVLENISESSESRGSNAFSFLHAIQSSKVLFNVVVLAEVFGLTLPLAWKLQAEYMDVLEAVKLMEATLASLREQRYKSTDTIKEIFKVSEKLAMEMGTQINKPRTFFQISKIIDSKSYTDSKAAITRVKQSSARCRTIEGQFTLLFSFEKRIMRLEADMEIRPFTKVSKVSCKRLQTGFCTTKY